jgi:hypothetical protein
MLDPAAMGTLLIGLDIEQHDQSRSDHRRRPVAAPRRKLFIRFAPLRGLRRAVSALARPTASEATNG